LKAEQVRPKKKHCAKSITYTKATPRHGQPKHGMVADEPHSGRGNGSRQTPGISCISPDWWHDGCSASSGRFSRRNNLARRWLLECIGDALQLT
jgi:hypothetical protein